MKLMPQRLSLRAMRLEMKVKWVTNLVTQSHHKALLMQLRKTTTMMIV